jgi:hypothetical protein
VSPDAVREVVDEALSTGYLAEAEAAFQRGELEDYFLFPAGKLKGGYVPPDRAAAAHASYQAMRDLFEDLERIAGVEHRSIWCSGVVGRVGRAYSYRRSTQCNRPARSGGGAPASLSTAVPTARRRCTASAFSVRCSGAAHVQPPQRIPLPR